MLRFTPFFLLLSFAIQAQEPLTFESIPDEVGNPMAEVNAIFKDREGFMWFGSPHGLYRYDGYKTIAFQHQVNDSSSIPSSNVWQITEDHESRLWISTQAGIAFLDPARKKFTSVFPAKGDTAHQRKPYTSALFIDRDQQLWFGSDYGLHLINLSTLQHQVFSIHDHTPFFPNHRMVSAIHADDKNNLWIATTTGLCRFNKSSLSWKYYMCPAPDKLQLPLQNTFMNILVQDSILWVSAWGGGLKKFNLSTEKFQTYVYEKNVPRSRWGQLNIVRTVIPINRNGKTEYWAATLDRTLARFNPSNGEFNFVTASECKGFELTSIHNIWCDDNRLLWVATPNHLYKVDLGRSKFVFHDFSRYTTNTRKEVIELATDTLHRVIYLATYGNEVLKWDYETNQFDRLPYKNKEGSQLTLLKLLPNGQLVIGSTTGLSVYDPITQRITTKLTDNKSKIEIIQNKEGKLLLVTFRFGLMTLSDDLSQTNPLLTSSGISVTEKYPLLFSAFFSSDGQWWLATHHDGLVNYDPVTDQWKNYKTTPDGTLFKSFEKITEDKYGNIWASGSDGLICIEKGKITKHYSHSNGLLSDAVHFIEADGNKIWITTGRGVSAIDINSGDVANYGREDGLEIYNLNVFPLARLPYDNMVVAQSGKLLTLKKEQTISRSSPPVVITEVSVLGKKLGLAPTELSYQQNQLTFEFALLDYTTPLRNQFLYKMEGADRDWNFSANHTANYAGLAPDHYTFRVKGNNGDGTWSDEALYSFTIQPAFWQTVWFKFIIIILILALAYSIYRYRMNELIKVQKIRNRIASDLHDDIGSALTSISLFSEAAKQHSSAEGLPIIEEVGVTSRKVLEDMNDIVWTISPKNDSFKNLFERMRSMGNQLFGIANISFSIEVDPRLFEARLSMSQRKNLYLIYKEAINNIIKYARATKVKAEIKSISKGIVLHVQDNGCGFEMSKATNGNGLDNMKMRAKEIRGIITIQSEVGSGTTIQLYFKSTDNGS